MSQTGIREGQSTEIYDKDTASEGLNLTVEYVKRIWGLN